MPIFKRVSADEAQSKAHEQRKDHIRDTAAGTAIIKAAKAPTSWDAERRSARFIMSTEQTDRYGDIVVSKGGDLTEFNRNPVGLLFHNSRSWPVAKWENVEVLARTRPPRIEGDFVVLPEGGPVKEVDECAWMLANDGIRACSIGFIPDWNDVEMILDDENERFTGLRFNKWEMTECSVCSVPANAGALRRSAHGDINLARELLEDVLDNWVKTPEGLILSRADFEATHKDVRGNPTSVVIEKSDDVEIPDNWETAHWLLREKVAKQINGGDLPDINGKKKDDVAKDIISEELARRSGQESSDLLKAIDETEGLPDETKQTLIQRGMVFCTELKSEEKTLAGYVIAKSQDDAEAIVAERGNDEKVVGELTEHKDVADVPSAEAVEKDASTGVVTVNVSADVEQATKDFDTLSEKIGGVEKQVEGLFARISKFFAGGEKSAPRVEPEITIEPEIKSPPTEDEIAAAKAKQAAVRERLIAKELIAAE